MIAVDVEEADEAARAAQATNVRLLHVAQRGGQGQDQGMTSINKSSQLTL